MKDRFRYLPILHDAFAVPTWWQDDDRLWRFSDRIVNGWQQIEIDLAHPAGWDHAVRGYVAISGGVVPESACCRFAWTDAAEGWSVDIEYGEDVPGRMVHLTNHSDWPTPAGRREALCRCICAALGLNVDEVFPIGKTP